MSERESYSEGSVIELRGEDAVTHAIDAARAFGESEWLSEDETARLCIVVEELVANLYEHGGVGNDDPVELTLSSDGSVVRVCITDPGTPFDPRTAPRGNRHVERGGGAGIDIIHAWVDVVDYQVTPNGNRLELLLPIVSA